jgi:hypothetical protein
MTPAAIRLIGDLVRAGAVVVGPKPLRSPSLEGWPRADAEVARLADEIWGDCDGIKVNQRRYGAGRVLWMPRLADALDACGVAPDVTWTGAPTDALDYIHRTADQTEVYFVTNRRAERIDVQISFRVTGLQPEWWDAETGVRAAAPIFVERDGRVEMPLRLAPHGSRFVVFRPRQARAPHYRSIANSAGPIAGLEVDHGGTYSLRRSDGAEVRVVVPEPPAPLKVDGPWQVTFQPSGDRPAFGVTFDSLVSWPLHRDERIRYFAGTATYRRDVEVPREFLQAGHRVRIDLGAVEVMARVCINDRDLGVAWKAPYQLEVSEALRPGRNRIEIKVTNLWINRLIGDEQAPADVEYRDSGELAALPTWWRDGQKRPSPRGSFVFWRHYRRDAPLVPSGLLGPVKLRATAALPPP